MTLSLGSLDEALRELRDLREVVRILEDLREGAESLADTVRRLAKRTRPVAVAAPAQASSPLAGLKTARPLRLWLMASLYLLASRSST
jgi:hypothetical protein